MEYLKKLKKHVLIIFLLCCTLPLCVCGAYLIFLGVHENKALLMLSGGIVAIIGIVAAFVAFSISYKRITPVEIASEKLIATVSEEERNVIALSSQGDPSKYIYSLMDYIAGKQMLSGSNFQQKNVFAAAALCGEQLVWRRDEDGDSYYVPGIWKMRYPELELEDKVPIENYLHPDDTEEFADLLSYLSEKENSISNVSISLKIGDKYIPVDINARSVKTGDKICIVAAINDEAKITAFENAINEQYLTYHFILSAVPDVIYEADMENQTFNILNPDKYSEMFDLPFNNNYSTMKEAYKSLIHPDNFQGFSDRFDNYDHLLFMPEKSITYDYRIRRKKEDYTWVRHSITCVKEENGHALKIIGLVADYNDKKRQEFRELYSNKHDALTGCFLRSGIEAEFNELCINQKNKDVAFVAVDINDFSHIVEFYGSRAGDIILRKVVTAIWASQLGKCSVGRLGNDDFLVIMYEVSERYKPEMVARRIISKFKDPVSADDYSIPVTVSVGCSEYGWNGRDFNKLYDKACAAQRAARETGENKFMTCSEMSKTV